MARKSTRSPYDFYPTPEYVTRALLDSYPPKTKWVIEPAAGRGAMVKVLQEYGYKVQAVELVSEYAEETAKLGVPISIGDWRELCARADIKAVLRLNGPWAIITNPPYTIAPDFTASCLKLMDLKLDSTGIYRTKSNIGYLALLLRLNMLAGPISTCWPRIWDRFKPTAIRSLHIRPSFTGKGTDMCNYTWVIWEQDRPPIDFEVIPSSRKCIRCRECSSCRKVEI